MFLSTLASVALQQDALGENSTRLLMIFIGIVAVCLLIQTCVILGVAIGAVKAQKAMSLRLESLQAKLMPLVDTKVVPLFDKSNALIADLTPQVKAIALKVEAISGNVETISVMVRDHVSEFGPTVSAANDTVRQANETVQQANRKTQEQVDRVNGMVTSVLDATASAGRTIQSGITTPIREVTGIVEGLKAGLMTLINGGPRSR